MERKSLLTLYSAAHCWVDLSCALLMFRLVSDAPEAAMCFLLYNFCAFALQMPLGLLADEFDRNGLVAAAGCCLTALAFAVPVPMAAAVTAGVGNALFHLGGGLDTLNRSTKKAAALGVFVSPGALGLYVGTLWGKGTVPGLWIAPAVLVLLGGGIVLLYRKRFGSFRAGNAPVELTVRGGWKTVAPLFLVVVLRSYMGMNQSFDWKGTGCWALVLTLALVLGKTAGGFAMDRLGARAASVWSLGLAAALYLVSALPLAGTAAVFLFNMTMPITLWAVARAMPGAKGFSFGLLTFALFLGYLPSWMGWPSLLTQPWTYSAAALLSAGLLWLPLRKERGKC